MKSYLVSKYKSPMHAGEAAEPTVGDRDVLVDVHAAGVNMLDAKIRDGEFKLILPYKAPFILGHDLAGVVTRVGSAVTRFTAGDEVYARVGFRLPLRLAITGLSLKTRRSSSTAMRRAKVPMRPSRARSL